MDSRTDRELTSPATPRRFIYRSAMQQDALPHPLRRATDLRPRRPLAAPLLAAPAAQAPLLQFRVWLSLD